ncbi:MAG: LptF/LptG family permease [Candidatus Algichlamydia australiensis]|nr:LptF/LptG family permease [Chlamydiales bacterium]
MKTLNRHLLLDIFKHIFFFLLLFYIFLVISDYSAHIQEFFKNRHIPLQEISLYYLCQLIKQLPILIPLSLLIASMKILISMNRHFEIVALQSAGVSKRKIALPFLIAALCCTSFLYISTEFFLPNAEKMITSFQKSHLTSGKKSRKKIQERDLVDGSKLIYQRYDPTTKTFYDLYYVKNLDDIWYAKTMKLSKEGTLVDHFARNEKRQLEKIESFTTFSLPLTTLKIQKQKSEEDLPIRKLWKMRHEEKAQTQIWLKLMLPLLSLIIVTAIVPTATSFARDKRHLTTFALSLFGFFAFFSIMNAGAIIGESGTLPPYLAVLPFPIALELYFLLRWIKA